MATIAIDIGHNCFPDIGAVGIRKECDLVREVGELLIFDLQEAGHKIVRTKPSQASSVTDSLRRRVVAANISNADYFISLHFNAFNGQAHGTEVFAISTTGKDLARCIVDEIADLGFRNRGVKDGSKLYVVKRTWMPAVLVECCFCDNQEDMERYNPETMSQAIFDGVIKFLEITKTD